MSKKKTQDNLDRKDEQPTAFDLDPERMAELMAIGSEGNNGDEPATLEQGHEKTSLLHKLLEEKLPPDSSDLKILPEGLGQIRRTIELLASETVRELLESPNTDQAMMGKIKDHFKALANSARSDVDYETTNTIYYAAIAHALVYHEVKITQFSYEDLARYLDFLMHQEWIFPYLSSLFRKAQEKCNDKK